MYPKVKTVRRGGRSYEYLELVEGRREGGRVRQHVVANLGRLDELVAGGQLEQLAAGLARLHQPPPGTRRHVGPLLVVAHYLQALDVAGIVDAVIPRRGEALAPAAEEVRGKLLLAAVRRFAVADASRLHLDLTAVRFTGHYGASGLVEKGWAADRTIGRQVKTVQATAPAGVPLYFRPHN